MPKVQKIHFQRYSCYQALCGVKCDDSTIITHGSKAGEVTCARCLKLIKEEQLDISPAMKILTLVWKNTNGVTGHSWERLNRTMSSALSTVIDGDIEFFPNDFEHISKEFRFGYWGGNDGHMCGERFYSLAVSTSNRSTAISFEQWKDRKPFMFNDDPKQKTNKRLAIGDQFKWYDETVKVTSFSKDGTCLIACSYKRGPEPKTCKKCHHTEHTYHTDEIKHRYKITVAGLRAEKAWLKAVKEFPNTEDHIKAAGKMSAKNYQELAVIDIAKELKGKRVTKKTIESLVEAQAKLKAALPAHRAKAKRK